MKIIQNKTRWKTPWLIQRLHRPHSFKIANELVDNPFSFGGGFKNGGLKDEAMALLRPIFSFDYMGSAEFEFGAVPKALQLLANSERERGSIKIGPVTVYYICPKDLQNDVTEFLKLLAKGRVRLKESSEFDCRFSKEPPRWELRTLGWLELDNAFAFFIDEEMFNKFAALFP